VSWTGLFSTLIASGMRGQKEENILPYLRGQVHGFTSCKLYLGGKMAGNQLFFERFQARNTGHPDMLLQ
jgi:hypothetical protein